VLFECCELILKDFNIQSQFLTMWAMFPSKRRPPNIFVDTKTQGLDFRQVASVPKKGYSNTVLETIHCLK
jgi:hypothetical protein